MPVQVSYPGVYIQEIPSGVHTITGVSTSIAAFFGRASKGKMNKAIRLLSYADYVRSFGAPHPMSDLANSVRLFFANGGSECYVVRLANSPRAASVTLPSLSAQPVLTATAKAEGQWANTVRLEVDYKTASPDDTFNLRVILEESGVATATETFSNLSMNPSSPRYAPAFVTQSSELIDLGPTAALTGIMNDSTESPAGFSLGLRPLGPLVSDVQTSLLGFLAAGQTKFDISVNDSPPVTVDLQNWAVSGAVGTQQSALAQRINDALAAQLPAPAPTVGVILNLLPSAAGAGGPIAAASRMLRITSTGGDTSSVRVRRAASNDLSETLMLGVDQGGLECARWSNFRPAPTATFLTLGAFTPGGPPGTQSLDNLVIASALVQTDITGMTIDGVAIPLNLISVPPGAATWSGNKVDDSPATGDNDGVREKLKLIAAAINSTPGLAWRAEATGYHLAIIARSGTVNQQPTIAFTGPTANALTNLRNAFVVNVRRYTLGTGGAPFTAGVDGFDGTFPTAADYMGNPIAQTGFYALDPVDLFNLMVLPADQQVLESVQLNLWGPASNYCASRRAFLLIDSPAGWTSPPSTTSPLSRPAIVNNLSKVDTDIRSKVVKINSAVFYPRLLFSDNGIVKPIGSGGVIAGLMARTDTERGVWKAPAGTGADLRGVIGLEVNLTDMENGVLNKIGVNCERMFPSGIVNWGARTMDGHDDFGSEWKYIPIRRLALFIEESLFRGTKWVVFEPNDEPLWASIRLNLNVFMRSLFRQGAFQGSTPAQAFYVKCDGETTTQNDRNLGIVNIEVGFAPLKPAEFVIIKIQQIAGDLT
jgi:phage tail sheath protein FI